MIYLMNSHDHKAIKKAISKLTVLCNKKATLENFEIINDLKELSAKLDNSKVILNF